MSRSLAAVISISSLVLGACAGGDDAATSDTAATSAAAQGPQKLGETTGFDTPESVRYDADLDAYFVASINGNPSQKDNNGYISRVHPDSTGTATRLVEGGRRGVTLHAPKGMAIKGDTLFVADIDAVRMFNKRTGASLGAVELGGQNAAFLNDVAVGPDGIYVTDTGIRFDAQGGMSQAAGAQRVFRITGNRATVVLRTDSLKNPNGITWDATNNRFILVPFGGNAITSWAPGASEPTTLVTGPGQFDGVEVLADGNVLISSWADSTVYIAHGGTHLMPLVKNVPAPADIGVDTKRNVLAVPLFNGGKVEYYRLP